MPVVFGPMPESNGWSVEPGLGGLPACSDWARSQHLDPVGSAGYYEGFLLIEQPLPWPFDVSSIPDLMEVAKLAASAHLRLQAVIPASGQEAGSRTMRVEADDAEEPGSRRRSGRLGWRSWSGPPGRAAERSAGSSKDHLLPVGPPGLGRPIGPLGAPCRGRFAGRGDR